MAYEEDEFPVGYDFAKASKQVERTTKAAIALQSGDLIMEPDGALLEVESVRTVQKVVRRGAVVKHRVEISFKDYGMTKVAPLQTSAFSRIAIVEKQTEGR